MTMTQKIELSTPHSVQESVKFKSKYNSLKRQDIKDYIIGYLQILESFIIMLLSTNETPNNISKLNYCYSYFNSIKWSLEDKRYPKSSHLIKTARSIIGRLQNCLSVLKLWKIDFSDVFPQRSKFHLNALRFNNLITNRSKKYHIPRVLCIDSAQLKHVINKLYKELVRNEKKSNIKNNDIQKAIDEMYFQTKTAVRENHLQDYYLLPNFNKYVYKERFAYSRKLLPPIKKCDNQTKPQIITSMHKCKMNGDNMDNFSVAFEKILSSNNFDFDVALFTERLFCSNIIYSKSENHQTMMVNECYSEKSDASTTDDEVDSCFIKNDNNMGLSYWGDCDCNSSNNTKSVGEWSKTASTETDKREIKTVLEQSNANAEPEDGGNDNNGKDIDGSKGKVVDDFKEDNGSDSDGGTELLNSVNDTLKRFNAMMQQQQQIDNDNYCLEAILQAPNCSRQPVSVCSDLVSSKDNSQSRQFLPQSPTKYFHIPNRRDYHILYQNHQRTAQIIPTSNVSYLSPSSSPSSTVQHIFCNKSPSRLQSSSSQSVTSCASSNSCTVSATNQLQEPVLGNLLITPVSLSNWCTTNSLSLTTSSIFDSRNSQFLSNSVKNNENYCSQPLPLWLQQTAASVSASPMHSNTKPVSLLSLPLSSCGAAGPPSVAGNITSGAGGSSASASSSIMSASNISTAVMAAAAAAAAAAATGSSTLPTYNYHRSLGPAPQPPQAPQPSQPPQSVTQHHNQQLPLSFHQMIVTPHMTIPLSSLASLQQNLIQLPQLYSQNQQRSPDSDYYGVQPPTVYTSSVVNLNYNNELRDRGLNVSFGNANSISTSSSNNSVSSSNSTNFNNSGNNNSSGAASTNNLCTNSNNNLCQYHFHNHSVFKNNLEKSQRACCFYMRGGCKKEDCEYAHDLSKVTCKFWEKGDCFKADTCPFKHG